MRYMYQMISDVNDLCDRRSSDRDSKNGSANGDREDLYDCMRLLYFMLTQSPLVHLISLERKELDFLRQTSIFC